MWLHLLSQVGCTIVCDRVKNEFVAVAGWEWGPTCPGLREVPCWGQEDGLTARGPVPRAPCC